MRAPLRTAVVGLGYFGRFHAKHYASNPDADLVAVCDVNPDRAGEIAAEFGGDSLSDHKALIGNVDAVSVAVPTSLHFEVARDLVEGGIHVLVEKPITHDVASADELVDLAEAKGVVLQIGHIERFSAAYRSLAEKGGQPIFVQARRISPWKPRATDVDVVLDLMIHDIDIVLGLVGQPLESVQAMGAPVVGETEDIANARLTFANGSVADITASRIAEKTERRIRVFQRDRYFECDLVDHRLIEFRRNGTGPVDGPPLTKASWDIPREDSLGNEISEFLDCVASRRRPTVDGRVGRDALHVATMITESMRAHRARIEASFAG